LRDALIRFVSGECEDEVPETVTVFLDRFVE
jgi:hypothetical protein